MIVYKKILLFVVPVLFIGTVYTQVIDKPVDVEKLTQEFMENHDYFAEERKRCKNLPPAIKDQDYVCVAVKNAQKQYLMKNYTHIGESEVLKELP